MKSCVVSPGHTVSLLAVALIEGAVPLMVTVTLSVRIHPCEEVTVAVYVVVPAGVAMGFAILGSDKVPAGSHDQV